MLLNELVSAFAALPGDLPPAAAVGLATVARDLPDGDIARGALIRRVEVPRDMARALVGPAPQHFHLPQYLARPDVTTDEVIATLTKVDRVLVHTEVAELTRDPQVLTHLADTDDTRVLKRVVANPATPVQVAAAAVGRCVDLIAEDGPLVPGAHEDVGPYSWLRYAHNVPDAVVNTWGRTTDNLTALLVPLTRRGGLDPALAARAAAMALALIPADVRDLKLAPEARSALGALGTVFDLPADVRRDLVSQLRERGMRVGRADAARSLRLADTAGRPRPVGTRSWRNVAAEAGKSATTAEALLELLTDVAGDDPTVWRTVARLSGQHTGTVGDLLQTASAIASPVPTN